MSTAKKPQAPAPTPEDLAAEQEARRRALVSDVDELAARMAPASLKRSALQTADSMMSTLRARGEELGAQARSQAQELGAQARHQAQALSAQAHDKAQGLMSKAGLSQGPAGGSAAPSGDGAQDPSAQAYGIYPAAPELVESLTVSERLNRLLDDARDGDPVALAIVTGAVLGLAGLSGAALIKAVSTLRSSGTVR